jgi:acetyl esterase/lipase
MRHGSIISLFLLVLLFSQSSFSYQTAVTAPQQPEKGPGGKDYKHASVSKKRFGEGANEYWIYEPDSPKPKSAPLIVFLHGWGGMNPMVYGAWIEHIVRRGNIVVYPRYQADLRTKADEFTPNTTVTGHSLGGALTANVAALAKENGLPKVRAMMSVEPARTLSPSLPTLVPLADLSKIPDDTLLLTIAGDKDNVAQDFDAKKIYTESTRVPANNKDFITLVTDTHGQPALEANHSAPSALDKSYDNGERRDNNSASQNGRGGGMLRGRLRERMQNRKQGDGNRNGENNTLERIPMDDPRRLSNALDYYGFWKLFDGLCDAAFYGKNREYALGNASKQRFMGLWSDGTPVKELIVTDTP